MIFSFRSLSKLCKLSIWY